MARVEADYQDRKRIVFTARGRSQVNVREVGPDGPIGFTSTELLLIALGNCTLGNVLNHPLLAEAGVRRARAVLDAEMARGPARVAKITVAIDLEVDAPALLSRHDDILRAAEGCPVGNTLRLVPEIEVLLNLKAPASD